MLKSLALTTMASAMMLATALWAQEAATGDTAGAATATEEGAAETTTGDAAGSGFDLGREVQEDPAYIDPTYIKEKYGDWQMRCFRIAEGDDPCQMFQLLLDEQDNPVAEFTVFRLEDGGAAVAGATITAPLFTLLSEAVKVSIDGGKIKSYPFRFCGPTGCVAQIGFTQEEVDAFKHGASATITIVPAQAPDQRVPIKASLDGFTAAYENVSVIAN